MAVNHTDQLEHLVGKMVIGARVLGTFLTYCGITDDGESYLSLAEQLAKTHHLTPNQTEYLMQTAVRARRARTLVAYLERRFGIVGGSTRKFRASSALYQYLTGESAKGVKATSETIMVEFTIPGWYEIDHEGNGEKGQLNGYAPSGVGSALNFATPTVMQTLGVGGEVNWRGLYYVMHPQRENPENYFSTRRHEQRHIFDGILPLGRENVFPETTAYLFTEKSRGGRQDMDRAMERHATRQEQLKRLEELNAPEPIIRKGQKSIAKSDREIKAIEDTWTALRGMSGEGFGEGDIQMLSYVISTMRPTNVPRRLRQIAEWRALHPSKLKRDWLSKLVKRVGIIR